MGCHFLLQGIFLIRDQTCVSFIAGLTLSHQGSSPPQFTQVLISCIQFSSVQFSSVTQSCSTLCNPMNRSMPGLPYCSWGSQGKNTEVVCHSLLQWTTFCQTSLPGASVGNHAGGTGHEERGLTKRKGRIRPQGSPWIFLSIFLQNQSLPALLCYAFHLFFGH